jgi:hypothetical protein
MSERHYAPTPHSRCFRCEAGCIHLVCGNAMLTLTHIEFLILAEAISAMRHQLKEGTRQAADATARTDADSFTM